MTATLRIGLTAVSLLALVAGAAQAQTRVLTMPGDLCAVDPLPRSAIEQVRARGDFPALLAYAADNCPEVALLLTDLPTATIGVSADPSSRGDYDYGQADNGGSNGGDDDDNGDDENGDDDHDHGGGHGGGGCGGGGGGGGGGCGGGGHGGGGQGGGGGGGGDHGDDHDHDEQPE